MAEEQPARGVCTAETFVVPTAPVAADKLHERLLGAVVLFVVLQLFVEEPHVVIVGNVALVKWEDAEVVVLLVCPPPPPSSTAVTGMRVAEVFRVRPAWCVGTTGGSVGGS